MKMRLLIICLIFFLPVISSCRQSAENARPDNKIKVVATIFPLYDFAREIGGDRINVSMILPPATDAHNYELKPDEIVKISKADLFLYVNLEMEQWAHKLLKTTSVKTNMLPVETGNGIVMLPISEEEKEYSAKGHRHSSQFDPHIWLDFDNAGKMVDNITAALVKTDSRHSDYYLKNAEEYKRKLNLLDTAFRTELKSCNNRLILHAGHSAFAYLANKYGIKYYATYAVSADAEPQPQKILALISQIKDTKTAYIYYEDLIAPRLAQTIATETGTGLLKLNNGHNISKKQMAERISFIKLMEENLSNLKKGMQCR